MKIVYFIIITCFLLFSCGNSQNSDSGLKEIPVDFSQKTISFPISELAEDITAIELELTDESMLSPEASDVFIFDNNLIINHYYGIFLFEMNGKFVCTIGSKGQGPGEYFSKSNVTVDEEKNRLYVNSGRKIICYDLTGKNYKESTLLQSKGISISDMNYINNELLVIGRRFSRDEKGHHVHSAIYRLNDELQITDSCTIRNEYTVGIITIGNVFGASLYKTDSTVYLYYPKNIRFDIDRAEKVLRDTLYRFENNQLIPEIKLNIKNRMRWTADEDFSLDHIHKSSRYIFVAYNRDYAFCYDMETEIKYNVLIFEPQKGSSYTSRSGVLIENAPGGDQTRRIRAVNNNPNLLYYLHTGMNPEDLEEPNPTLYIIKLKK